MRPNAFTLIEVVASLVLIGTVVTALLTAHGRSLAQLHGIQRNERASILARELITEWKLDRSVQPPAVEGGFEAHPGWRWMRTSIFYAGTSRSALQEVTLTIYRTHEQSGDKVLTSYTWLERAGADGL